MTGQGSYNETETSNALTGDFSEMVTGTDHYQRQTTSGMPGWPPTTTNDGGQLLLMMNESGNWLTGSLTMQEYGSDRYSLLTGFNNASNAASGAEAGTVAFSPEGAPFSVGPVSNGTGTAQTYAGAAGAEGVNQVQSSGYDDGAGRMSRLLGEAAGVEPAGIGQSGAETQASSASLGAELYKQYCFAKGTRLLTPDGSKPIEEFQVGDVLLSRDENDPSGPVLGKTVEEVFVNLARLWLVQAAGQEIWTTAEHPFYTKRRGWTPAGEMEVGDLLLGHDGRWVVLEKLEDTGEDDTVYNVRIADWHTYFVGCQEWGWSVWSHNQYTSKPEFLKHERPFASDAEAEEQWNAYQQVANDLSPEDGPMLVNPDHIAFDAYVQPVATNDAERYTRQSEYPHDFRAGVRDGIIAQNTSPTGDVIDPNTGEVIPPDQVTIEHIMPVAEHWNTIGHNTTKEARTDWYNLESNLTVMPKRQNSAEGAERQNEGLVFRQDTGPNYR